MIVLYALIGLVVGGVINLLADVLPYRHKKVTAPVCPACNQPRLAVQSLAVLAFLIGKRKCPSCGRPIAWRNPVVELMLAALFALLYNFYSEQLIKLVLASLFTSVLLLLTVTDLEHRLIPNRVILPAIVIAALVSPVWFWYEYFYVAFIGGAIGYGFFWVVAVLGEKFLGPGAMGGGDVKLAAFVGLITGFPGIITALVVTIVAGGVISLVLLLTRVVNLRSGIPYGPFICLGGFITMLYGQQLMNRIFFGP
ncbi:MAG TPA: A24 family peptidase [Anaerolineae bacterium]|nr:A24 family peptidase [Anaerolineae bacterium]